MSGWTISLNREHVALLGRATRWWLSYVAFCVVAGWGLGPRWDEVLTLTLLPLGVLLPYAVGCLAVAALRVLLVGPWSPPSEHSVGRGVSAALAAAAAAIIVLHFSGRLPDGFVAEIRVWYFLLGAGLVLAGICHLVERCHPKRLR
jgi:hypothetical protein